MPTSTDAEEKLADDIHKLFYETFGTGAHGGSEFRGAMLHCLIAAFREQLVREMLELCTEHIPETHEDVIIGCNCGTLFQGSISELLSTGLPQWEQHIRAIAASDVRVTKEGANE